MANKIQYVVNSSGDNIYPVTHERGVLDSKGVTLEKKLLRPLAEVHVLGNGNTYASTRCDSFLPNHTYRSYIQSWPHDSVTSSSSSALFAVYSNNGSETPAILTVPMSDTLAAYYDVTIPADSVYITIGGRINSGSEGVVTVEDITISSALESDMATRPAATLNVVSNNILSPSMLKGTSSNMYIQKSNGAVGTGSNMFGYTDYIPLPTEGLIINNGYIPSGGSACQFAYYNSSKEFISAVSSSTKKAAEWAEGRAYVRFTLGNPSNFSEGESYAVFKGTTLKPYDAYRTELQYGTDNIVEKAVTPGKLSDDTVALAASPLTEIRLIGAGDLLVKQAIANFDKGHRYRIIVREWAHDGVTQISSAYVQFGLFSNLTDSRDDCLAGAYGEEEIESQYEITIPSDCNTLILAGRANSGSLCRVAIEDITSAAELATEVGGYRTYYPQVLKQTKMLINDGNSFASNASATYVIYYIPVNAGDIAHFKAHGSAGSTLKIGFSKAAPEAGNYVWSCKSDFNTTDVDYEVAAPISGYFCIYHVSGSFADQRIWVDGVTQDASTVRTLGDDMELILKATGGDYVKVNPLWRLGYFVNYNSADTPSYATLSHTDYVSINGAKYLFFTQNTIVTTASNAGLRFYDSEGNGLRGYRQIIGADANGIKPVLVEIPEEAASFRATCWTASSSRWFGYLFSDDKIANLIRKATETKHLKICMLGNSYTTDAWRYVPKMLLEYGITMESYIYYRGSGSLWDLDEQWEHTSATDIANYSGATQMRFTYYVNSANSPIWEERTRMSAAQVVAARKWDIIVMQQAGGVTSMDGYTNYMQSILDKINAICNYPYLLCWYMAYAGSHLSSDEEFKARSIANQQAMLKMYPFSMIIPACTSVWNADTNDVLVELGDSEYKHMTAADNVHLQEGLPCYVAACCVVQALLKRFKPEMSVQNDQFRATAENIAYLGLSGTADGESTGVTEENCTLAQRAAILANEYPFEILPII